jgi:hypothetical protein
MVSTGTNTLNLLGFDFAAAQTTPHSWYAYNQLNDLQTRRPVDLEPIEDVRIGALIEPQAAGVSVQLNTTCRLDDPQGRVWQLEASIDDTGQAKLIARSSFGQERTLAQTTVEPLKKGHAARLELWYADQQASFWIDGKRTLVWEFDALLIRPGPAKLPAVNLGVRGQAVVREIELDRDIFYTGRDPRSRMGLGVLEQDILALGPAGVPLAAIARQRRAGIRHRVARLARRFVQRSKLGVGRRQCGALDGRQRLGWSLAGGQR